MKNILVPTDFSKCAYYALEVAVQIAKKTNASIHLLHVVDIPITSYDVGINTFENIPETMFLMNNAKDSMAKLKQDKLLTDIDVTTTVEFDLTYSRITNEASNRNADMIVMGSHGASGVQEFIIGSNAERVVRFSECPVLIIKNQLENIQFENIVYASNFREDTDVFYNKLNSFVQLFDAQLHLLKVNTALNFEATTTSQSLMDSFINKHQVKNYTTQIYNDEREEDGILNYAKNINADLIIMGTHGKTGLAHLVNGSLAESVINHTARPILTIKI